MNEAMGWLRRATLGVVCAAFVVLPVVLAPCASAAPDPAASAEGAEPAASAEEPRGPSPWKDGPGSIDLGHDVALELPAAYRFLPKEPAAKAMEANGHFHNEDLLGIVAGADGNEDWFAVLSYDEEGYIKDDEKIDADELLSSMRDGTKEMNEERQKHGFKPLSLDGWSDPPRYDQAKHQLVWALIVSDPDGKSVNYNTRILGRRGYVSLNVVTDPDKLAAHRPDAASLLTATHFTTGARYQDFDSKKDKVAEYGLAGLIMAGAGLGAAKLIKIGLLAKFWKVILAAIIAGKKVLAGLVVAGIAFLKRLFGAKKKEPQQAGPQP